MNSSARLWPGCASLTLRLLGVGLALAFVVSTATVQAQPAAGSAPKPAAPAPAKPGAAPAAPAAAPEPAAASRDEPNTMTRAVVQRGALKCAARVEQIAKMLGYGPQSSGLVMAPASPVDQLLFSVVVAHPANATDMGVVGLDFAPNQANGCGASMQAVAYWPQSCKALADGTMSQMKKLEPLKPDILVLDAGPSSKVFLMKAGNGCVSIKKEIVF